MLKNILAVSCLLLTSINSQAALISHNGYERDSGSNIVKGGGLEWLMWDVTKNKSINDIRSDASFKGWTIASNTQMVQLFNAFMFGAAGWYNSTYQSINQPWAPGDLNSINKAFLDLFGRTNHSSSAFFCTEGNLKDCDIADDPYEIAMAMFGDQTHSGNFRTAFVYDDSSYYDELGHFSISSPTGATLGAAITSPDSRYTFVGVALVREDTTSQVNGPASISILVIGLIAFGFRHRRSIQ